MKKRIILLTLLIVTFHLIQPVSALFDGYDRCDTKAVTGAEYEQLLQRVSDFTLVDDPEQNRMIKCFAISQKGKIALAFDGEYAQIDAYDSDGTFLYGYTFQNNGSAFSVFFEKEMLSVYHPKDDFVASFDSTGKCVFIQKPIENQNTTNAYHEDIRRPDSATVGERTYKAENTVSLISYGRFIVTDGAGNQRVIYEASIQGTLTTVMAGAAVCGFIGFVSYYQIKKWKREAEEDPQNK